MSIKEVQKLIRKLPEVELDEKDIQSVCLQILYDIDGDTAQHHRAKIEALRLLADITLKKKSDEEGEFGDAAVLKILAGGKK